MPGKKKVRKAAIKRGRLYSEFVKMMAAAKILSYIEHENDPEELEAWEADEIISLDSSAIYVAQCGKKNVKADHKNHAHPGVYYIVYINTYSPGYRECPPDSEPVDLGHFDSMQDAFKKAAQALIDSRVNEMGRA